MIVALSGGVGGARMLTGLYAHVPQALTAIVNVGDDESIYGLAISPDIDTVLYHLSGMTDWDRGWGIQSDTFHTLERLRSLGEVAWFQLGDRDLATHLYRTERLRSGASLSLVTAELATALGITCTILPSTDTSLRTTLTTESGPMAFQEWFVRQRSAPVVTNIEFQGSDSAIAQPVALDAIYQAEQIIICPSNPFLSIDPILALPEIRTALEQQRERVSVVSPLIGGAAVRGPAERLFRWQGIDPGVHAIANHYASIATNMVCDTSDELQASALEELGWNVLVTDTLMSNPAEAQRLAKEVLQWRQYDY